MKFFDHLIVIDQVANRNAKSGNARKHGHCKTARLCALIALGLPKHDMPMGCSEVTLAHFTPSISLHHRSSDRVRGGGASPGFSSPG
ncbi:MAG: hypothetical protein JJU07_16135 [Natronohydrobacter sp.]|nr:hypothetical protein [Natronohydrobacter sp.]